MPPRYLVLSGLLAIAVVASASLAARQAGARTRRLRRNSQPQPAAVSRAGPARRRAGHRSGSAAAADVPRRHQPRSRRLHRHRQEGAAGDGPAAGRLPGLGGRRAAGGDVVQVVQDRRAEPDDARAADPDDVRRRVGGAAPGRAAVLVLPRRLPRAPRQRDARAHRSRQLRPQRGRAAGHGEHHVPARAARRGGAEPRSREPRAGARKIRRTKVRLHAAQPVRGRDRELPDPDHRAGSARRVAVGPEGTDHQAGRPPRGQEGARARQRGLLQLHPAADAEHRTGR